MKPGPKRRPAEERFWPKVDKTATCWNWNAHVHKGGYGVFRAPDRNEFAHRMAFMLTNGPIPKGLTLDHLCKNKRCVNPAHLEAVTSRVNTLRSDGITARAARQTHCKNGHEFSPANTYWIRGKYGRKCRICMEKQRRHFYAERMRKKVTA